MVLHVGADGLLADGPLPPGPATKVVALVDGKPVEVYVINNPGGGGTPNFLARQTIGVQVQAVLSAIAAAVTVGVGVAPRITVVSVQSVGVAATPLVAGTVKPPLVAGVAVSPILNGPKALANIGAEIVQIKYDLTRTNPASVAANTGADAWANPNNALGAPNDVYAQAQGNAVNARTYQLELSFPAANGKGDLTITAVQMKFYTQMNSSVAGNSVVTHKWSTGGAFTNARVNSADFNNLAAPYVLDLFAAGIDTWDEVNALKARVDLATAALSVATANIDAVELVVTATRTDAL